MRCGGSRWPAHRMPGWSGSCRGLSVPASRAVPCPGRQLRPVPCCARPRPRPGERAPCLRVPPRTLRPHSPSRSTRPAGPTSWTMGLDAQCGAEPGRRRGHHGRAGQHQEVGAEQLPGRDRCPVPAQLDVRYAHAGLAGDGGGVDEQLTGILAWLGDECTLRRPVAEEQPDSIDRLADRVVGQVGPQPDDHVGHLPVGHGLSEGALLSVVAVQQGGTGLPAHDGGFQPRW